MEARPRRVGLISRPRLNALLDQASRYRLTLLSGGPGMGKTTLLEEWVERHPTVWHSLTPADTSLPFFARRLMGRLRLLVPAMSQDLLVVTEAMTGAETPQGDAERVEAFAAAACQELETHLRRDLTLVLDDVQLLSPGSNSSRFLGALVHHAPATLHFVLASRASPPFPMARLRMDHQVLELTRDQLAFTADEVVDLLRSKGLPAEQADGLVEWTGGWPAALAYAVEMRAGIDGRLLRTDDRASSGLFEYLAEVTIGSEPPEQFNALRLAAELPWFTASLLEKLRIELDTSRPTIYLVPASDSLGAVSISPILRDFLRLHHPLSPDERAGLLGLAADWYRSNGAASEALACLREAGDSSEIVAFLRVEGDALLAAGLARQVAVAIDDLSGGHDDLGLLQAEAMQYLGDWEGAARRYTELATVEGKMPAGLAWRLGFLHHMRGDLVRAMDTYLRGRVDGSDPDNEASLLGWTASACWLRGERDRARALADQALDLARSVDSPRALATAHTVLAMVAALDGDRAANDVHYLRALEHAERARDVLQSIRIRSNRASHFLEEGNLDTATAELDIALRLAEMTGFELWRAMSLSNRGQVLHLRGRLDEAMADLSQSRQIFRRLGSSLESYPLARQGDVYATRGDSALATLAYEGAIRLAEGSSDQQALVPALAGLAKLLAAEDVDRAEEMAGRASQVATVLGHVQALLAQGTVALAKGERESAGIIAERAADLARSRRDLPGLAEALTLWAETSTDADRRSTLLQQARSVWSEVGAPIGEAEVDLRVAAEKDDAAGAALARRSADRLRKLGARGMAVEAAHLAETISRAELKPVIIRTFGGFTILVGDRQIASSAWQSRVAREILGMLITARGRSLHREVLIDRLWPDEELAKASNRLSVALSTIRSVLDPDRAHPGEFYLAADRDSVALNLDNVDIDIETFLEEARRGQVLLRGGHSEEGLGFLASAEGRYVGDFLEEYPYADWSTAIREHARTAFMTTVGELAAADMAAGDHESAARRYLRMVEFDAYNEKAHLGLVNAMRAAGRHGAARRLYGIYVARMRELDLEPTPFSSI